MGVCPYQLRGYTGYIGYKHVSKFTHLTCNLRAFSVLSMPTIKFCANGDKLSEWMRKRRYTTVALADALGVSTSTVRNWRSMSDSLPPLVQFALLGLESGGEIQIVEPPPIPITIEIKASTPGTTNEG